MCLYKQVDDNIRTVAIKKRFRLKVRRVFRDISRGCRAEDNGYIRTTTGVCKYTYGRHFAVRGIVTFRTLEIEKLARTPRRRGTTSFVVVVFVNEKNVVPLPVSVLGGGWLRRVFGGEERGEEFTSNVWNERRRTNISRRQIYSTPRVSQFLQVKRARDTIDGRCISTYVSRSTRGHLLSILRDGINEYVPVSVFDGNRLAARTGLIKNHIHPRRIFPIRGSSDAFTDRFSIALGPRETR